MPSIKDYDIVLDIWNTSAKVTVRELLANPQYRAELLTVIYIIKNWGSNSNMNQVIKTTALYVKVHINSQKTKIIPNSKAAISIIRKKRTQKLRLKIQLTPSRKLSAFGNLLNIIGQTKAVIKIKDVEIPVHFLIINSNQKTILLEMN